MFHSNRWAVVGVVALSLATSAATSQNQGKSEKAKPAPEEWTGPKVGTPAAKFTLKDQAGAERTLDGFLGKGKVALVFTRSADW